MPIFSGFASQKAAAYTASTPCPTTSTCAWKSPPTIALSDFVKVLKQESSKWMKERREWFPLFEGWANGYAAFTYSAEERPNVMAYIRNQKEHHKKVTFKDEFLRLMAEFRLDARTDRFLED